MAKKIYSAGLVSQRFWFYEVKQYLELRSMGKSDDVISSLSDTENIFGAVSQSRAREIYRTVKHRGNVLGEEMQQEFFELDIDNQKLVALIAIFLLNDLIFEFVTEVYREQLNKGILELTITDYKAFFSEKQRTNEIVARWKPYTYSRLISVYRNYLLEAGLIREEAGVDVITPAVVDKRVEIWLSDIGRLDILKAITGVA